MTLNAILFKDVDVSVGKQKILSDINLEIAEGSRVVLIGPSGGGKSTLLRCIYAFYKPQRGYILVNGKNFLNLKKSELYKERQNIGVVFQQYNLYPHYTVLDNLILAPIKLKKVSKDAAISYAERLIADIGLSDKKDSYPLSLSGGQQQRVAIARALMMEPRILLFDEPTSSLDPEMTNDVLCLIESVAREHNVTMVLVTHEMKFAERVANTMFFLESGKIIYEGETKTTFNDCKNERVLSFINTLYT